MSRNVTLKPGVVTVHEQDGSNKRYFGSCIHQLVIYIAVVQITMYTLSHTALKIGRLCIACDLQKNVCNEMNLDLRKPIVKCLVWSVALYAAETWTVFKTDEKDRSF